MCVQHHCVKPMIDSIAEEISDMGAPGKEEATGETMGAMKEPWAFAEATPEVKRLEMRRGSVDDLAAVWRSRLKTYTKIPTGGDRLGLLARLSFDAELQCLDVQEERAPDSTEVAVGTVSIAPAELYPMSALEACIAIDPVGTDHDFFELRVRFFHEGIEALVLRFESFDDRAAFSQTLDSLATEALEQEKWHSSDCENSTDLGDDESEEECCREYI